MSRPDVIGLLHQLIEIDSVNPSLSAGGAGEDAIAAFVEQWALAAGLRVERVETAAGRPSVIVRGGSASGGRRLLLCGHLDTVGLAGVRDALIPRVAGDRMYGRGSYDMKAGLAAALVACREAAGASVRGEVIVAAVADEEHSSIGIQDVLPRLLADAAVVTEPTEMTIALAHKGFVWTEIVIEGIAAHGSRPHLGVDAIMRAGPVLVALEQLDRSLSTRVHADLGPGTLHASLISGGTEESTIPERCVITIERRTLPGESVADIETEVAELLGRCREADPTLVVSSRVTLAREPLQTEVDAEIVQTLIGASAAVTGAASQTGAMSYWTDAAFIAAAGIPTVLFGPAGDGAHAEVEWVSLSSTVRCADVLTQAALTFCT